MIEVRTCSVAEIVNAPNFAEFVTEYAAQSQFAQLGEARPHLDTYYVLEKSGLFHAAGAFDDGKVVGFIFSIINMLPHQGWTASTVESFFVSAEYRKRGVGLNLLRHTEKKAQECGAKVLLVSAPVESRLAQMLPYRDYTLGNQVFVKVLA